MAKIKKWENCKQIKLAENQRRHGAEIREKYGEQTVADAEKKWMGLTEEDYRHSQQLATDVLDVLAGVLERGEGPQSAEAQRACQLHKQWLLYFWPTYSTLAHRNLGEMYVNDHRFKAYYDEHRPGAAQLLRDALQIFAAE